MRPRRRVGLGLWAAVLAVSALGAPGAVGKPAITADACRQGAALEALGRDKQAIAAYLKGIATTATLACSRDGLARLAANICQAAEALNDAGQRAHAHGAYNKLLEDVPGSMCARAGAAATDPRTTIWQRFGRAIVDVGNVVILSALAWLVVSSVGTALLWLGARSLRVRRSRLVRWLRRPVLALSELDDAAAPGVGPATTAVLRANLAKGSPMALNRVDLVATEVASAQTLDPLSSIAPSVAAAAALLKLIRTTTPRVEWRVKGQLQGEGEAGFGVTVAVQTGRRYRSFASFWSDRDAGPAQANPTAAETFRRLMIPAGGWLEHQLAEALQPGSLLSRDAMSWALLANGLHWQEQGQPDIAEDYYRRALQLDPENVAALTNLGVARADQGAPEEAVNYLSHALGVMKAWETENRAPQGGPPVRRPPLTYDANWYRVKYGLVACYANSAAREGPGAPRAGNDQARTEARELVDAVVATRAELALRVWPHPIKTVRRWRDLPRATRKRLEFFLRDSIEPSALILYAGSLTPPDAAQTTEPSVDYHALQQELREQEPRPEVLVAYLLTLEDPTPRVLYNLACLYAVWKRWPQAEEALRRSINRTPPLQRPRQVRLALDDATLTALREREPELAGWLRDQAPATDREGAGDPQQASST